MFDRVHFPLAYAGQGLHPHRLALVFDILGCGALNAIADRSEANAKAHEYIGIAQSILASSRFTAQPSIASVQTLLVICRFKTAMGATEESYALGGLALRLAQATGLHRDPAAWHIEWQEADQRRALWHDCLFMDTMNALLLGRPCGVNSAHFDTAIPSGQGLRWSQPNNVDGETGDFHRAKWTLSGIVHGVVDQAFGWRKPAYPSA